MNLTTKYFYIDGDSSYPNICDKDDLFVVVQFEMSDGMLGSYKTAIGTKDKVSAIKEGTKVVETANGKIGVGIYLLEDTRTKVEKLVAFVLPPTFIYSKSNKPATLYVGPFYVEKSKK